MYDELIKNLRGRSQFLLPHYGEETSYDSDLMKQAADAIEELTAIREQQKAQIIVMAADGNPRWVPVTEALPECDLGEEVGNIEWISCGMVHAGCFGRGGKYRDAYFRTWTDAGEGMDAKDADYWRAVTLPEPPKEET